MFSFRVDDDLELRLLEERYAKDLFELMHKNRDHLSKWIRWPDRVTVLEDMSLHIRDILRRFAFNEGFEAGIWYRGELAGSIALHEVNANHRTAEIAYWLGESFQGNGIITRACRPLINYGFNEYKLNRVEIAVYAENKRSRAIPERLGFTEEGTLRQLLWHHDHFVDLVVYSMLAEEWRERSLNNPSP